MRFKSEQFIDQGNTLVQEASTLGLKPGQPFSATMPSGDHGVLVEFPGGVVEFRYIGTDRDTSGEDIIGRRFRSRAGKHLLIIND